MKKPGENTVSYYKDTYRRLAEQLGEIKDAKSTQQAISELLEGVIVLHPTEQGLEAEYENGGLVAAISRNVVAGAG